MCVPMLEAVGASADGDDVMKERGHEITKRQNDRKLD